MVKARTSLRDGDTIGRLRRGFSSTQNSHPVDAMTRASCFSRRQFHRLMVQVLGEIPERTNAGSDWTAGHGCF
jgi:hypothetical protein